MAKNYYLILGVDGSATEEGIKSAYRRQARLLHPEASGRDVGPFCDLQEAYTVLRSPVRRQGYDEALLAVRSGRKAKMIEPEPLSPIDEEARDLGKVSLTRSFQTYAPSFDEIFDYLWGNFSGLHRPKAERVRSLGVEITVTPDEAERGGQARILVPARAQCPTCHGRAFVGPYECWRCAGEGSISGEFPLSLSFPPGIPDRHAVEISLGHLGIRNCYLTVQLRVTGECEE